MVNSALRVFSDVNKNGTFMLRPLLTTFTSPTTSSIQMEYDFQTNLNGNMGLGFFKNTLPAEPTVGIFKKP